MLLQAYTEAARLQTGVEDKQLQAMEGQLTWLVHIVGAIIRDDKPPAAVQNLKR